jgi:hypothetical protein
MAPFFVSVFLILESAFYAESNFLCNIQFPALVAGSSSIASHVVWPKCFPLILMVLCIASLAPRMNRFAMLGSRNKCGKLSVE